MKLLIFYVTPMELCYLSKLQILILYLNKNNRKILTYFRGAKKIIKLLSFLLVDSVFYYFEHLFESHDISF
jgi:hypothetical protein